MLKYQDFFYNDDEFPIGPFLEEWKEVVGYSNYHVSNYGRVKSFLRKNPKILSGNMSLGYLQVKLTGDKGLYNPGIHRIEGIAFLGNPPTEKHQINHKNGFKTDNFILNFEWLNVSENVKHAYKMGMNFSSMKGVTGANNPFSKRVFQYDLNGKLIKEWDSVMLASTELNIHRSNISQVCTGRNPKRTTAGGFFWRHDKVFNTLKKQLISKNKKPYTKRTRIQEPKFYNV